MTIHNITVINRSGGVALCQHYDRSSGEERLAWEATLACVIFTEDGGAVRSSCFEAETVRVVG
jgi:hypothetical protein